MNDTMLTYLFGAIDPWTLAAAFFWAMVGVTISIMYNTAKRDIKDTRTPDEFSTWFMIKDNGFRIFRSSLVILSVLVFSQQILGVELNNWIGFGVGLGLDRIVATLLKLAKGKKDEPKKD